MDKEQQKLIEELLFSENKILSFAKKLYFGVFDSTTLFPYPKVSDEEERKTKELLEKLDKLLINELDPIKIDKEAKIPDSLIEHLGQLGILGMTIPNEYEGLGLSQYAYCKAVERIAYDCAATALFVNAHQSIGLKALLLFGTEKQKKLWLKDLATGKSIAAFSLTEANAGSDASGVETEAVYDEASDSYILNGKKQWTTNGSIAKVLTVMAKTKVATKEGMQDKITAFLVTPDMPGFEVTAESLEKVGMKGSKTANLAFHNMKVPKENILGPLGGGLKVCLTVLDFGRTTFGASCTGSAKFLVEKAIEHAKTRNQFNRPLASFGLVKEKIAKMRAYLYAMEATTYATAGLVDSKQEDFMVESAILKVFASDSLWNILYDTMQIYGGRSFFTNAPFERMMRDARLNMIGEGSNEVMRAFIGAIGLRDLGLELKSLTEGKGVFKFLKRLCKSAFLPKIPVQSKELAKETKDLAKDIRRFGFASLQVLGKFKEQVVEQQLVLNRLAEMLIVIYTKVTVISKIDAAIQNNLAKKEEIKIAKFYCLIANERFKTAITNLFDPNDEEIKQLSDYLTGI